MSFANARRFIFCCTVEVKKGTSRQQSHTAACCVGFHYYPTTLFLPAFVLHFGGVIMEKCKVLIVGSGASGLYAAYCLVNQKLTSDIIILEAEDRIGG